jgi:hypothetical protein
VSRDALEREILALDARLDARQAELDGARRAVRAQLRSLSPGWWLGGGLLLGFVVGRQRHPPRLRQLRSGLSLLSLLRTGLAVGAGAL